MGLLNFYILKVYFKTLGFCLLGTVMVFLVANNIEMVARFQPSLSDLGEYYTYFLPEIIFKVFPFAGVLAGLITVYQFKKKGELEAFLSLGVGFFRIFLPIAGVLAAWPLLIITLLDPFVAWSADRSEYVYYTKLKKSPHLYSSVRQSRLWYRFGNNFLSLQSLQPHKKQASGVKIFRFAPEVWEVKSILTSEKLSWQGEEWILFEGSEVILGPEGEIQEQAFKSKEISLGRDLSGFGTQSDVDGMTLRQLRNFISVNRASGVDIRYYEMEYYFKLVYMLSGLFLFFAIFPLFCIFYNGYANQEVKFGFLIFIAYWALYTLSKKMSLELLWPAFAATLPLLFLTILGVYLWDKHRLWNFKVYGKLASQAREFLNKKA